MTIITFREAADQVYVRLSVQDSVETLVTRSMHGPLMLVTAEDGTRVAVGVDGIQRIDPS